MNEIEKRRSDRALEIVRADEDEAVFDDYEKTIKETNIERYLGNSLWDGRCSGMPNNWFFTEISEMHTIFEECISAIDEDAFGLEIYDLDRDDYATPVKIHITGFELE